MDGLAESAWSRACSVISVAASARTISAVQMTRLLRDLRPICTPTRLKAGALGRLACAIAPGSAPRVRIHTFHGHVLSDYFSPLPTSFFR